MIGAAVSERELEGPVAGRKAEQLVAEADPEERNAAEKFAQDQTKFTGPIQGLWVKP